MPKEQDWMDISRREIAILKKISNHPNVCTLVEVLNDDHDDHLYLVFQLCTHGTVMKLNVSAPVRPFTEALARRYFRDIVLGLEFLHQQAIIHRDIKTENLLLTEDNHVQIVDFGISQFVDTDHAGAVLVGAEDESWFKHLHGSPLFMAPEACRIEAKEQIGKPFDLWALGVTLYAFVHGHCPFEETDILQLAHLIQFTEPSYRSDLSHSVLDLIKGLLRKDSRERMTISEIREHPWVTMDGIWPLLSPEENCGRYVSDRDWEKNDGLLTVNQAEIDRAIQPATSVFARLFDKIRHKRSKQPNASGHLAGSAVRTASPSQNKGDWRGVVASTRSGDVTPANYHSQAEDESDKGSPKSGRATPEKNTPFFGNSSGGISSRDGLKRSESPSIQLEPLAEHEEHDQDQERLE